MPPIAKAAAETFAVAEYDNGDGTFDRFMKADVSIRAEGARYEALVLYAQIMVVVWVFGFPMALFALLWSHRHAIESRTSRRGGAALKTLSFLFRCETRAFALFLPLSLTHTHSTVSHSLRLTPPPPILFARLFAPDSWHMAIVDLIRRLLLTSFLLVLDPEVQLWCGACI